MKEFAQRLKLLRTKVLNFSMTKIATEMGINQSNFSQYENGSVKPGLSFLYTICEKYGVSANWLILGIKPIMIKDLNTVDVDITELVVARRKVYEEKIDSIQNQLKEAVKEYKRKL
jgi:transcriptional regulator with XRE-family HTH domain